MVMLWMVIQHVTLLVSAFITVYISNRVGLVHSLHFRFILLLSYFLLLLFGLKNIPQLFFIIPILIGAEEAFYWIPLNILFVRNTKESDMGSSVGKFFVIPKIFSILSPIIGAFIIIDFGFTSLFSIAMILLFFTFLPVFSLRSEKTNFIFTWQMAVDIFRKNKKYFIPEVVDNIAEDAMVIWQIFIYLQLASTLQVGIIGTIVSASSLLFTLSVGKLTDRWNKHKLLKIGAVVLSLAWVVNFFISGATLSKWMFYIATIFVAFSLKTFLVPYSSLLFNRARKDDAQFIILREIPVVLGRIILYGTAILFYNKLPILFLIIGILFTYFWFLDTKKLE
jgi:MFS family permease